MKKKIGILTAILIFLFTLSAFALPDKFLYITLPQDGFQDNVGMMHIGGLYDTGLVNSDISKITLKVTSPQLTPAQMKEKFELERNTYKVATGEGNFDFNLWSLEPKKYELTVSILYDGVLKCTDTVNFEVIPKDQTPTWQENPIGGGSLPNLNVKQIPNLPKNPDGYPYYHLVSSGKENDSNYLTSDLYCYFYTRPLVIDNSNGENILRYFENGISSKYYYQKWVYSYTTKIWTMRDDFGTSGLNFLNYGNDTFIRANYTIKSKDGNTTYFNMPMPKGNSLNIVLPRDGMKESGTLMSLGIIYKSVFDNASPSDFSFDITSPQINLISKGTVQSNTYNSTKKEGNLTIILNPLPPNKYTVNVILKYKGSEIAKDTVNFEMFEGVVDNNNDGTDDNTNLPVDWGASTPTTPTDGQSGAMPDKSKYTNDILGNLAWGFDTLFAIISYPFVMFAKFCKMVADNAVGLTSSFGDFSKFIGDVLGFLPTQMKTLILTVFAILSGITIWKAVKS